MISQTPFWPRSALFVNYNPSLFQCDRVSFQESLENSEVQEISTRDEREEDSYHEPESISEVLPNIMHDDDEAAQKKESPKSENVNRPTTDDNTEQASYRQQPQKPIHIYWEPYQDESHKLDADPAEADLSKSYPAKAFIERSPTPADEPSTSVPENKKDNVKVTFIEENKPAAVEEPKPFAIFWEPYRHEEDILPVQDDHMSQSYPAKSFLHEPRDEVSKSCEEDEGISHQIPTVCAQPAVTPVNQSNVFTDQQGIAEHTVSDQPSKDLPQDRSVTAVFQDELCKLYEENEGLQNLLSATEQQTKVLTQNKPETVQPGASRFDKNQSSESVDKEGKHSAQVGQSAAESKSAKPYQIFWEPYRHEEDKQDTNHDDQMSQSVPRSQVPDPSPHDLSKSYGTKEFHAGRASYIDDWSPVKEDLRSYENVKAKEEDEGSREKEAHSSHKYSDEWDMMSPHELVSSPNISESPNQVQKPENSHSPVRSKMFSAQKGSAGLNDCMLLSDNITSPGMSCSEFKVFSTDNTVSVHSPNRTSDNPSRSSAKNDVTPPDELSLQGMSENLSYNEYFLALPPDEDRQSYLGFTDDDDIPVPSMSENGKK